MGYLILIAGIFVLDLLLKTLADFALDSEESRDLFKKKVYLKKYYNTGSAGNLLADHPTAVRRIHGGVLACVFGALLLLLPRRGCKLRKLGLSLAAAGGLGNLFDRWRRGYVIDYAGFCFGPKWFRRVLFNLSDFCVFAGILLALPGMLGKKR